MDVLAPLLDLPGVADSAARARDRVDQLLWDRSLRTKGPALAVLVQRENSRASAAIDGVDITMSAWSSGDAFDDSPFGKAAAGYWRLEQSLKDQVQTWGIAPMQVLARMHSLVAADLITDADQLGRPRSDEDADDPLRLKMLPDVSSMKVRLAGLMGVITNETAAPAIVQAAIVHGELLALRPFGWGNGPIARAAMRLVMAQRGLDPDLLAMTDASILAAGRPAYVDAARNYIKATPESVATWIRFCADSIAVGARLSLDQLGQIQI